MNASSHAHEELISSVANSYRADGYEVALEPGTSAVPFDLGGYRPDLIARKGDLALIVEVKASGEKTSYEQLRPLVEETKRHQGWRFVLVTGRDIPGSGMQEEAVQFSWPEIKQGIENAERLHTAGESEAAYLVLWIAFERTMRKLAHEIGLPLDRLAPAILIRQLYSQGVLTMAEFDTALYCQNLRNLLVHGFRAPDVLEGYERLQELLTESLARRHGPHGQNQS